MSRYPGCGCINPIPKQNYQFSGTVWSIDELFISRLGSFAGQVVDFDHNINGTLH